MFGIRLLLSGGIVQTEAIDKNLRIAVLAGGSSSEREVSLNSGANARKALLEAGYETVDMLDPANKTFIDAIQSYDLAFLALHGAGGEDGEIQHVLDYLGFPIQHRMLFRAPAEPIKRCRNSSMRALASRLQRA